MPPKKASAPKRNGKDPELSQLLRLVLEKLGREEAGEVMESPVQDVGGDRSCHPKQSHVAPSAAFTPVKRKRSDKTPAPASSTQTPNAVASPPVHIDLPEPPALVAAPSHVTQGVAVNTFASPVPGLEGVLADILKSLASLAPTAQSGPPHPLTRDSFARSSTCSAACTPPTAKAPEHQAQVQDPSRKPLLEVSRLLASINAPPNNSPPSTTRWGADDSLQNTLKELKRQVDALSAAHTSNPQASVHSPSVTLTPGAVIASPPYFKTSCLVPARFRVRITLQRKGQQMRYYPDQVS
ncbi:hypothetical protein NDU88_005436 [Pleurodeles waltl]|uniref:Uncharacterized protein n=1 Tax=Pleurodeles waltl TaxID=8319 RepID=A0AAV7LL39_PLEWA|nr:hypothetical protein NDU88_005436 [Pleurodeles waltl]